MWNRLQSTLAVGTLTLAGLGAAATPANAGYNSGYTPDYAPAHCCRYEKVISYELQKQYETRWETVYDSYGCPHRVQKTYAHYVKVPVVKLVKVCH